MNIPGFLLGKAAWAVKQKNKLGLVFILSVFVFLCGVRLTVQSKSNSTEGQKWVCNGEL